jgi:hypothetical protein
MQSRHAFVASVALAVGAALLFAACHDGGGGRSGGFTQTVRNGDTQGRVDMNHPKVPKSFPSTLVPLPQEGVLQAVISGGKHFYTFTYGLAGKNGRTVGVDYRRALEKASFTIKGFSSTGGSDGPFTTFDATSPRWDVTVVAGKGSKLETATMSVQVATHGTLSDDLDELDVLGNGGSTNSTSTTTSTLVPLDG